jgi:hypothetical protein
MDDDVLRDYEDQLLEDFSPLQAKDPFPNSWPTCLARWTAHFLLMLDNQSNLLLMTGRILVKNTSPRHTALHIQSCYGCQQNWLSGLGQIFAKN